MADRPISAGRGRIVGAVMLGIAAVYLAFTLAFAGYLLSRMYRRTLTDFDKASAGALIAVIGTGLTALGTFYTSNRQASAAAQLEAYRRQGAREAAEFQAGLTSGLDEVKAHAVESLERLKTSLDAGKVAYRELFGASTIYFYTLRSAALGEWDDSALKKAEALMIETTRHLLYVSVEVRDEWLAFWQEAQRIHRTALGEGDEKKRPGIVRERMLERIKDGSSTLDLRERHSRLEQTAKSAVVKGLN